MLEFRSPNSNAVPISMVSMNQFVDPHHQGSFVGGTPLAALQGMTDMKSQMLQNSYANQSVSKALAAHYNSGTPHGINDILSRPVAGSMTGSGLSVPQLNLSPTGMYFSANPSSRFGTKPMTDLASRAHLYWPGIPLQSPSATWRTDRFSSCTGPPGGMTIDKDGKKKHTRPTFSGHQIFALEKTFEQTKYLAGPERARLAYSLGMSEAQVKVWFQNRRTKWRKKHAAEMASAKQRQDKEAEKQADDEKSDDENSRHLPPRYGDNNNSNNSDTSSYISMGCS